MALPLLAGLVGARAAVPAIAALSCAVGLALGLTHRAHIDWRGAGGLLAGAVVALPVGVLALKWAPVETLERALGVALVGAGVAGLALRGRASGWASARSAPAFGVVAGLLGGMLGTSGPPVVVWAAGTGWPPARVRATLQGVFVPLSVLTVAGHLSAGLWSMPSAVVAALGLPAIGVGSWLGNRLAPRIPTATFQGALHGGLVLLGLGMLL